MTCSTLTPIDPTSVAKTQILHDSRKRDVAHLNSQVDMSAHKAEGMDAVAKAFDPFLNQKAEASAIPIIEENRLPASAQFLSIEISHQSW